MLEKMSPIMPSRRIEETEAFYFKLGFFTVYKDIGDGPRHGYLLMKREGAEVHFFEKRDHDNRTCDHGAYLRPNNIDELSGEWAMLGLPDAGIPRFVPAEDKPWGMRELAMIDLDGNLLRAGQEI